MNKYTKELVKPGDTFVHIESGAIYRLLKIETIARNYRRKMSAPPEPGKPELVYMFLDLSTNQQVDYTWGMFRDRLKYAPATAQILYSDKDDGLDKT